MGGKGKKGKDGYTVCRNVSCTWRDAKGFPDWRWYQSGPNCCRHCKTPFRIPAWASGSVGNGGNGGGGGRSGGGGTGGSAGGGSQGGWKVFNSKGRARDAPDQDEWPLPFNPKAKGKAQKQVSFDDKSGDEWLAKLYKERFKDDPQKLQVLEDFFPPEPEEPKTEADMLRDSIASVEKAQASLAHFSKVCDDMDVSARKKIQELLDYKENLQKHLDLREAAAKSLKEAKLELAKMQAKQASADGPFVAVVSDPRTLVASYNPAQALCERLQSIEGFDQLSPALGNLVHTGIHQLMQEHVQMFATHLFDQPQSQSPPLPPPNPDPTLPNADAVLAGGGSIDRNMLPTVAGKRTWEDISSFDISQGTDFQEDMEEVFGQEGVQQESGAGTTSDNTPVIAAGKDTVSLLQDIAVAATTAIHGKPAATPQLV